MQIEGMISQYDNAYRDEERAVSNAARERVAEVEPVVVEWASVLEDAAVEFKKANLHVQYDMVLKLIDSLYGELDSAKEWVE